MRVVVSQSMYFPWVGMLEQIRLAEVYVRYDDVQFSKGSFTNRVQVKTPTGTCWLTVPLRREQIGRIDETAIDDRKNWRKNHRSTLRQAYSRAPFRDEMLALVDRVLDLPAGTIAEVAFASMWALADYFGIGTTTEIRNSAEMSLSGAGSDRLLGLLQAVGCTSYVTGHGARNYLDHESFERSGIRVGYMQYRCVPYPQLHGPFNPFVSALDLIANCGPAGQAAIQSETINWRSYINEPT